MSDTNCPSPHDAMIATLRERRADLEIEERVLRGRIAELDELIVLTERSRPRVKKPRNASAGEVAELAGQTARDPLLDVTPRPTVFAVPSGEPGDAAEAA